MNRDNMIEGDEDTFREGWAEFVKNAKPTRSAVSLGDIESSRRLRHESVGHPVAIDVAR